MCVSDLRCIITLYVVYGNLRVCVRSEPRLAMREQDCIRRHRTKKLDLHLLTDVTTYVHVCTVYAIMHLCVLPRVHLPCLWQGRVAFSNDGDRIAWTQVEQMIKGRYHKLGYFDVQTDNLTWFNREQWIGEPR